MTKTKLPEEAEDNRRKPQNQTAESKGAVKSEGMTDREMPEKDLARGSEPQTRAASRGR